MAVPLKIVFLGSDPIALPLLNWLVGEGSALGRIIAVFTQPDRATGRGQKIVPNDIKTWALEKQYLLYQPDKLTEAVQVQLAALDADVALVMAYGHILRDDFIGTPRLGTLNLHASILPRYRGASPIQSALANGETETGVSLMRIVRRLDAGPVADVERVPIAPLDTALEIEAKLSAACVPLLARNLAKLSDHTLEFTVQDEAAATYCRRLTKEDGLIDFEKPAHELAARINGLFPWPACSVELSKQPIKLGLADAVDVVATIDANQAPVSAGSAEIPGTVLGADPHGLLVQTGRGILRLRRLQRPGGRMLEAVDFLRGFPVARGAVIPSQTMLPLVGPSPFKK
jgi:methionyl-tRNA formyltransferase